MAALPAIQAPSAVSPDQQATARSTTAARFPSRKISNRSSRRSCTDCHGGETPKGSFNSETLAGLIKGGQSGNPAVISGRADTSPLIRFVRDKVEDLEMPPLSRTPSICAPHHGRDPKAFAVDRPRTSGIARVVRLLEGARPASAPSSVFSATSRAAPHSAGTYGLARAFRTAHDRSASQNGPRQRRQIRLVSPTVDCIARPQQGVVAKRSGEIHCPQFRSTNSIVQLISLGWLLAACGWLRS